MSRNFKKTPIFTLGQKEGFHLTHSAPEYFEKSLKEVHSNFFKIALFFACATHMGTWQWALPLQPTVPLPVALNVERVEDELGKHLN